MSIKYSIIALACFIPVIIGQKSCGQILPQSTSGVDGHIIGSEDTDSSPLFYPWHLAIEKQTTPGGEWTYQCGATLIYDTWALTTGRCVEDPGSNITFRVVAGDWDRDVDEGTEQYIGVSQLTTHPNYDFTAPFFANNIALLSLSEPANLTSDFINTLCLPEADFNFIENPSCYITGWGVAWLNDTDALYSPRLRRSGIDVIETEFYCLLRIGVGFDVNEDQTCVMDQANREVSICDGDMGGPLSCLQNAKWYSAGVASHTTNLLCDPETPQLYATTAKYLDWISQVTGVTNK